jgi:PAS domain S-box-containing protein
MLKLKLHFLEHLAWKLLVLSLIIAAVSAYLLKEMFYPYQCTVLEHDHNAQYVKIYHDFDNDGFSESLEFTNLPQVKRYNIHIRNWSGGIIDQTNYWEGINHGFLLFADLTGDKYDEIIIFTQDEDSLFLYAHDIITKRAILNRVFLVQTEAHLSHTGRYVAFYPACIADRTIYEQKVIIFAIRSSSLLPREVYAFDLENQCIVHKFETHAAFSGLFVYDLTGDGLDEIIIISSAWGNIHSPAQYSDDTCWLFVLDQRLNPVFPPLSFSQYPAELACVPMEINTERYLLTIPDYFGDKNVTRMMYLIDVRGKIHLRTHNPFRDFVRYKPVASSNKNPSQVYCWQGNNELVKLNHHLETVSRASTPFEQLKILTIKDLDADGDEEILCISKNFFSVFDDELNLLSKFPGSYGSPFSFRETGPNEPLEIGLQAKNTFYRLSLTENRLYSLFPLLFIGLTGAVFLILSGARKLLMNIIIYINIFKHFFFDSSDGILIVNRQGKILYTNNQIHPILGLPHAPLKGEYMASVLNPYSQIIKIFRECLENGQTVQQKVVLGERESRFEAEISVRPFRSLFQSGICYLVELRSAQLSSVSEKMQTWSRAVQKMAHDIKTPLSTVNLNLKALQIRLEKIQIPENDRLELSDDIQMMRTELENIQVMTKNFLKFSNLDKPHFQVYDIKKIIEEALIKYRNYVTTDLDIQVAIDEDIKPVWADPKQIEMVFHILLENALTATQGKGLISISVSLAQYLDKDFLEYLEIEVADTGPGISESDKSKIFEPYFTSKSDGTGIGLAIARKIIEDHEGSIEVHSKPDFGAVFRFSIPIITEEEKNG